MPLVRDRSICLRVTEFSETSQVVTLLSREHGLVRAIAKGAHRKTKAGASKFDGGMDFLEVGEAVFTHDVAKDLAILTEWQEFREPDFARMKKLLKNPVVFDGRNIYQPAQMKELGFTYYSIGR